METMRGDGEVEAKWGEVQEELEEVKERNDAREVNVLAMPHEVAVQEQGKEPTWSKRNTQLRRT